MIAPVHRLKKDEILWLAKHKCQHRHTYLEHYSCYLSEHPQQTRRGFFDIESTHLKGNFGLMLSYCILDDATDKIYSRTVNRREILNPNIRDRNVVRQLIKDLENFDQVVTYYGCATPGHKVLMSDLTWKDIAAINAGDEIIGFEENSTPNRRRHYCKATVLHNIPINRELVKITLEDKTSLIVTPDHPFLTKRAGYRFLPAKDLLHPNCKVPSLTKFLDVWEENKTTSAGYIAGFIDGEGNISQVDKGRGFNEYSLSIKASQNEGIILNRFLDELTSCGFNFTVNKYDPLNRKCLAVQIGGTKADKLKFLGSIRPAKIQSQFDVNKLSGIARQEHVPVVKIEPVGTGVVMALGTTSQTYFLNGYASHNTRFDIPYSRTRAMAHGLIFPTYGTLKHKDLYYTVKFKFSLHSNRLENACRTLCGSTGKTKLLPEIWQRAAYGDPGSLKYIYDHCVEDVKDLKRLYYKTLEYAYPGQRAI